MKTVEVPVRRRFREVFKPQGPAVLSDATR